MSNPFFQDWIDIILDKVPGDELNNWTNDQITELYCRELPIEKAIEIIKEGPRNDTSKTSKS